MADIKKWRKQTDPIGRGSQGEVYLAVAVDDTNSNSSMIAVKSRDMSYAFDLQREARILRQLRGCPHIIQCFGDDVTDQYYNLLLEYAPAGNLHRLIYPGRCWDYKMAESDAAFYTYQILKGLLQLHDKGLVHCDLKPENILVFPGTREGKFVLKLADFGVSTRAGKNDYDEDEDEGYDNGEPFLPYHCRGSLVFASPDYLSSGIHRTLDDIWSLGCIVVEMLTGNPPWLCKSINDLISQIEYEKPAIPEDITKTAKDFLNKCFYKKENGDDERWTARRLLAHPFIRDNKLDGYEDGIMLSCPNNPLSYDDNQWVSTKDLFPSP
ncbi:PREDICTED: mitogen-activated protein kinase kinase kinase 3-like [Ipomoea nil]|uniref:mitogen-activated protein kinase kinase kinase 3-like n=1 Tax=Ipomoea nil TaxID=35883 RepID=UPI000901C5A7|nr:PREDICTED: mitogen-activated protein kinase kinase kinase 3-like [Ipomoea nil]